MIGSYRTWRRAHPAERVPLAAHGMLTTVAIWILATAGLHDTRVLYHEPAKWIARLRAVSPDGDYLLKTEMSAGHAGPSGRYDSWREEAFATAWILTRLGAATT